MVVMMMMIMMMQCAANNDNDDGEAADDDDYDFDDDNPLWGGDVTRVFITEYSCRWMVMRVGTKMVILSLLIRIRKS